MFELTTPFALFLLLVPLALWWLCRPSKKNTAFSLKVPFFDFINTEHASQKHYHLAHVFWLYLIWALIVFALSGPRYVGAPRPLSHEGHNIMLVLDISGSMEIRDRTLNNAPATRLDLVKKAAKAFVKNRKQDQIGLILFGTRAYLQTPLTRDHQTVLMRLDDATVGLAGKTTSIGDALGLAIKHMQDIPKKGRVIILLTDGANNSGTLMPLKAAKLAEKDEIKVYTIGLSNEGNIPLFGSMPVVDDLDEHTLEEIAQLTGGHYFHATDMHSLQKTYARINALETVKQSTQTTRPEKPYYHYPLTLALIMLGLWIIVALYRGRTS